MAMRRLYLYLIVTSALVVAPALSGRANAQTFSSSYTSTAEKDCRVKKMEYDVSTRLCPGKAGLVVLVSEDDLRQTVSVGRNQKAAEDEPAAHDGFGPFNFTTDTVEWRAIDGKPFAIIQRWHISDNNDMDKNGRPIGKGLLVVRGSRPDRYAMSLISTSVPIQIRTSWHARLPTKSPAISNAARTRSGSQASAAAPPSWPSAERTPLPLFLATSGRAAH
jgi:hypothetical protein